MSKEKDNDTSNLMLMFFSIFCWLIGVLTGIALQYCRKGGCI